MALSGAKFQEASLGQYGSTLLLGDNDLIDLSGSSATRYVCSITFLEDTQFHDLETLGGEIGSFSTVTAENNLDDADNGIGASGNGTDLVQDASGQVFPKGITVFGRWDKVELHSGACICYFAPVLYMLSLGSNISTTQAVEAKYSASFDGNGDFIDLGNSDDIISTSQANVTLMCWVKPQEEAGNQYIFTNKRTAGSSNFSLRMHSDSGIKFNGLIYTGTGLSTTLTSTTTVTAGTWYHVAVTAKANEQKIYINGQLEHTLTLAFGMSPSATNECTIGSFGSGSEYEGLILELAIFNACLTGNAVLAAYNSGFDLKTNVGDYTNSSDITHYYKMGDGFFDDKANGVVHDQDNPGFGSDLVLAGDFSDVSEWSVGTGWAIAGGKATCTSGNSNLQQNGTEGGGSTWIVAGKTYKIIYTISDYTSGNLVIDIGGSSAYTDSSPTVGANKIYLTTVNTNHLRFYGGAFRGSISNVIVHQLNGNPGLTSGGVTFSSDNP